MIRSRRGVIRSRHGDCCQAWSVWGDLPVMYYSMSRTQTGYGSRSRDRSGGMIIFEARVKWCVDG